MRHELKYLVRDKQLAELGSLLSSTISTDIHQSNDGYTIRSLYFDTENDRLLEENLAGIDNRNKYRIRTYDNSTEVIHYEKKFTINNLKDKEQSNISKDNVVKLLNNDDWYNGEDGVLKEAYLLEKSEMLKPKVIVEYDRYAYVYDIGNVRITFDKNIRASSELSEFLADPLFIPVLPMDRHILEVKYDGILPGFIARLLNLSNLERISFSKYALCRNVIANNGRLLETYEY